MQNLSYRSQDQGQNVLGTLWPRCIDNNVTDEPVCRRKAEKRDISLSTLWPPQCQNCCLKRVAGYGNSRVPDRIKWARGEPCNHLLFADPKEVHGSYYTLAAILFFPSGISKLSSTLRWVSSGFEKSALLASFKSIVLKERNGKVEREGKRKKDPQHSEMLLGWERGSNLARIMLSYFVKPLMLEFIY